jgi:hypothetical protein
MPIRHGRAGPLTRPRQRAGGSSHTITIQSESLLVARSAAPALSSRDRWIALNRRGGSRDGATGGRGGGGGGAGRGAGAAQHIAAISANLEGIDQAIERIELGVRDTSHSIAGSRKRPQSAVSALSRVSRPPYHPTPERAERGAEPAAAKRHKMQRKCDDRHRLDFRPRRYATWSAPRGGPELVRDRRDAIMTQCCQEASARQNVSGADLR